MAIAITFQGHAEDADGGSSSTFTSVNIGDAATDRMVVVGLSVIVNSSDASVPTCTIGGVSATQILQRASASNAGFQCVFYILNVTSGTTATIVITKGGTSDMNRCGIGYWSMTGQGTGTTPYATASNDGTSPTIGTTINIAANGGVIAISENSAMEGGNTTTWTGVTERYDTATAGFVLHSGANDNFANAATGATIQAAWTGAATNYDVIAAVSFALPVVGPANVKTINGLAIASVKTVNGLAIASVKTWNGLA